MPLPSRRSIIAFWLVLGLARQAFAQELCLVPQESLPEPAADNGNPADADAIIIDSKRFALNADNEIEFEGEVEITRAPARSPRRAQRGIRVATLTCSAASRSPIPKSSVFGEDAHYDADTETVSFSAAGFDLPTRPARGSAEQLQISSDSRVSLSNVLFTTCPPDNVAWELSAREIDLDVNGGVGKARGVKLDFKGVPILYAPYFSFPINNERKSGFLVPEPTARDRTGFDLTVPYYLNLAPNYDLTLEPRYMSKRGTQVRSDFRYLMPNSRGELGFEYMPDDKETQTIAPLRESAARVAVRPARPIAGARGNRRGLRRCVLRRSRQQLGHHEPDASEPLPRSHVPFAELVATDALAELPDDRPRAHGHRASLRARAANDVRRPLARPATPLRLEHGAREFRPQRRRRRAGGSTRRRNSACASRVRACS